MKSQHTISAAIAIACGLTLAACGDTGESTKENVRQTTKNFLIGSGVNGDWSAGCADSEWLDASVKRTFSFKGNELKKIYSFYDNADCKNKIATLTYQGSYELSRDDKKRDDYRNVDLNYNSVRIEAVNDAGKKLLEAVDFCGIKEWPVGKELDVSTETGSWTCPFSKTPRKEYELVKQDGDKLYFGKGGSEAPDQKSDRPADVDQDTVFKRQ